MSHSGIFRPKKMETEVVRKVDNAYYIPANYETVFNISLKRPAVRVWSYVVFQGEIPDSREVINESHNIFERLFRLFFVQYAQAEGISDRYEHEKLSPTNWKLKYVTPEPLASTNSLRLLNMLTLQN